MQKHLGLISAVLLLSSGTCLAQHPFEVQRKVADGNHFDALVLFDEMPQRKVTTASRVAAGRSAWALGLPERAIAEFETALHDPNLDAVEQARLHLSRGIIELQEERPRVAVLYAKKVCSLLEQPSPLRARAWLLWGKGLARNGAHLQALEKYQQALAETEVDAQPEVHYLLGETFARLGNYEDAQMHLEQVPLDHERTPQALRLLANVSLEQGQPSTAAFWLSKGRSEFPDQFLDSWVDYALARVAIDKGDATAVQAIQKDAAKKYPPSDYWFNLLNAAAETFYWKQVH